MKAQKIPRTLGLFTLAMINLAAVGGVKNWPLVAEYGLSSIVYVVLAALFFFIPAALVSAELATGWPKEGGVFVWVKEAFGHRTGFLAIWLQWIENVVWYPTILSFIAATIFYIFSPQLVSNVPYMVVFILILFWLATLVNFSGMRTSGLVSSLGVVLGTFLPALIIVTLGTLWVIHGNPIQFSLSLQNLIPDLSNIDQLVFFSGIILAFTGMEMSSVHALDVKNPQRDYPKAILLSVILILGLTILGVLAIASVVPQNQISLVSGGIQAFSYFVDAYGLKDLTPYMAALIAIGAIGSLSTWILGPCKGLLAAAHAGDLPPIFRRTNKKGVPVSLLIIQALLVSGLSLIFVVMPSINSGYWALSALVVELYLVMYILMFSASIKLRYKRPHVPRAFLIPGGKCGIWIVSGVGILSSLFTMVVGLFPPAQITTGNTTIYVTYLITGLIVFCCAPRVILLFKKRSWESSSSL